MTNTYLITGMTCEGCEAKVSKLLLGVEGVNSVKLDRIRNEAEISMSSRVDVEILKKALSAYPKYKLEQQKFVQDINQELGKSWVQTYKPILLVFLFIAGTTLLIQFAEAEFSMMNWMRHFMSGFFLTFSFFKLLNLQGFADSYSSYDIIAKRFKIYAFIYPFIELSLGVAYLVDFQPMFTNLLTSVVMGISLIGVVQSILDKRKIKCACLGDVFNLPMSTITIIEDSLMILMALWMLFQF